MRRLVSTIFILALFFASQIANAQNNIKTYDFKEFDKVQIEDVNGEVEVVLGEQYSIVVSGEDNAQDQIRIIKSKNKLLIRLDSIYVTEWKKRKPVKVQITLPKISTLYNFSNADVNVKKLGGKFLVVENKGNGNILLDGSTIDLLEIKNNGNGNVETKNIFSKKIDIIKSGNGDVIIRTDANFEVQMAGNGDIVNYGKGRATIKKQSGTGKVVYKN